MTKWTATDNVCSRQASAGSTSCTSCPASGSYSPPGATSSTQCLSDVAGGLATCAASTTDGSCRTSSPLPSPSLLHPARSPTRSGRWRRRRLAGRARASARPCPACMPVRLPELPRLRHDAAPARVPEGVRVRRGAARPRELRRVRRTRLALRRTYRWGRPRLQRDSACRWGEVRERCLCHWCVMNWIVRVVRVADFWCAARCGRGYVLSQDGENCVDPLAIQA